MSLAELSVHSLLPGAWLDQAQTALDALSELTTVDQVAEHFGNARRLARTVLGSPASGGHATKPAVRTLGQLLHHRLGPAVAAEALSWAAAVADVADSTTIEELLRTAGDSYVALRPIVLADRPPMIGYLHRQRTPSARRAALLDVRHTITTTRATDWITSSTRVDDSRTSRSAGVRGTTPSTMSARATVACSWAADCCRAVNAGGQINTRGTTYRAVGCAPD